MKMTRRNFLSTSAVAALACGASLTAHAAGSTDENSLKFITDIFKDSTQPGEVEEATAITAEKNAEWYEKLDFSDRREFANAERGWLDNAEGRIIDGEDNRSAWDLQSYGDLNRDAPDTVNPSLWRNTQLNAKAGLFEVCDGIYQVRGFDMANTTFIRTDHGWIVFDVLMCKENMKAAKELMEERFGPLDIKAVLYSHRSTVLHAYGAALPDVMCLSARDCVLPVVPMFHVNAWGLPYSAALTGAKMVLPGPALDGKSLYELMEAEGVSFAAGVPTVWQMLLAHVRQNGLRFHSLQRTVVGGAA